MRFSFYRIRKLWLGAARMYWLIILGMAVGTLLLVTCLNMVFSSQDALAQSKEEMAENIIPIGYWGTADDDPTKERMETAEYGEIVTFDNYDELEFPYPISQEEFQTIEEEFGDSLEFYFGAEQKDSYYLGEDSEELFQDIYYIYLNDKLFEYYFSFPREEGKAYVGSVAYDCYKQLEAGKNQLGEALKYLPGDGKLWLSEDVGIAYEQLPENAAPEQLENPSRDVLIRKETAKPIEECVILPIELMEQGTLYGMNTDSIFMVSYLNEDTVDNQVLDLINRLMELSPGLSFNTNGSYLMMEKSIADQSSLILMVTGASVTVLAIVLISMIGILLILLQRRRKSIAITYCCGATKKRSFLELLAETTVVFLLGGVLGLVGSAVIMPRLQSSFYDMNFYPQNIGIVLAASVAAALVCCGIAQAGVPVREPARELKEL